MAPPRVSYFSGSGPNSPSNSNRAHQRQLGEVQPRSRDGSILSQSFTENGSFTELSPSAILPNSVKLRVIFKSAGHTIRDN